jgi:hypothetical protein
MLNKIINQLEEDSEDYEQLTSLSRGLYYVVTDHWPFSESSYGRELLLVLNQFMTHIENQPNS